MSTSESLCICLSVSPTELASGANVISWWLGNGVDLQHGLEGLVRALPLSSFSWGSIDSSSCVQTLGAHMKQYRGSNNTDQTWCK